jgi:hypothetical protein
LKLKQGSQRHASGNEMSRCSCSGLPANGGY